MRKAKNQFPEAEAAYEQALGIYLTLTETNSHIYPPDIAMTLNNLANLWKAMKKFHKAEAAYKEALAIRRRLAEANPQTYLPDVAITLNNLAVFRADMKQFLGAETAYEEAFSIYSTLAKTNSGTYLPDISMAAMNMSIFYLGGAVPDREKSLAFAREALLAAFPLVASVPSVQYDVNRALQVVSEWGSGCAGLLGGDDSWSVRRRGGGNGGPDALNGEKRIVRD